MINFNKKRKRGFTLIEISIVLVIIGVILASVMKGRDLIKSSQIKEFNQVFVSQWETIANSYFSRMGAVLVDGTANGGSESSLDGFMDGKAGDSSIKTKLSDAGIDIDDLIKTDLGDAFKRSVDGSFTGKKTVSIEFYSYKIGTKQKNYLIFRDIPGDVGLAIDTIRDGVPNGKKGSVLAIPNTNTSANEADINDSIEDWDSSTFQDMLISLEH